MRKALLVVVIAGSLLAPASSEAAPFRSAPAGVASPFAGTARVAQGGVCGCVIQFTTWYTANAYNARRIVLRSMRRRGVSAGWRKRFNKGVYDYERGGYGTKKGWCRRNVKACRAVIACVAAAAGYLIVSPSPESLSVKARKSAKACAVAATAALLTP
jgi:hypothetical protein